MCVLRATNSLYLPFFQRTPSPFELIMNNTRRPGSFSMSPSALCRCRFISPSPFTLLQFQLNLHAFFLLFLHSSFFHFLSFPSLRLVRSSSKWNDVCHRSASASALHSLRFARLLQFQKKQVHRSSTKFLFAFLCLVKPDARCAFKRETSAGRRVGKSRMREVKRDSECEQETDSDCRGKQRSRRARELTKRGMRTSAERR